MGLPLRPGARPFDLPSWKQLRETLFSVQRAITFQYSTAADQSPGSLRVGFPFAQTPPTNFLSPYFGPRRPVPSAPSVPSTRLLIQQVVGYYDSLLLFKYARVTSQVHVCHNFFFIKNGESRARGNHRFSLKKGRQLFLKDLEIFVQSG